MLFFRQSRAREYDPYKLASPQIYLWRMIIFLIIAAFIALILYRQVYTAFLANPGLNGVIIAVLAIGIVLAFRQVLPPVPRDPLGQHLPRRRARHRGRARAGAAGADGDAPRRPHRPHGDLDPDHAVDPQLDPDAPRRGSRHVALPRQPADLPRPARHLLGPAADRQRGRRHHPEPRRLLGQHRRHLRGPQGRPRRAARRHGHRLLVLAVRPRRLADPRLPRPPGRPGAEHVLQRPRGLAVDGHRPRSGPDRRPRRHHRRGSPRRDRAAVAHDPGEPAAGRRSRSAAARSAPPPPWPISPRASRASSSTCAASSRSSAAGSRPSPSSSARSRRCSRRSPRALQTPAAGE